MLKIESADVVVGKGSVLERKVLFDLDLNVPKGEFLVVIGGNGAGKSTMFNLITGYMKPEKGELYLDGERITHRSQAKRSKDVSIVMQDPRIGTMEHMTILENMSFAYKRGVGRHFRLFTNRARRAYFREKLSLLNMGLENRLNELVGNLSGGQRQALSLIMAIISESKILLLDEITAALDPSIAETVMQIANDIVREEHLTCIMITHNMEHALTYGDRTMLLKEGRFRRCYTREEKQKLTPVDLAKVFAEA